MEAVNSSETSINFYLTTWQHIPENGMHPAASVSTLLMWQVSVQHW
jgi:hypothetical protein